VNAQPLKDPISEERLAGVNPALAWKVRAAAGILAAQGQYFRVACGFRSYADEDKLYLQGRFGNPGDVVTDARGGWSNHNFGCAVDCYPFLTGGDGPLNWAPKSAQFQRMVQALKAQGLAWGGDWQSLHDWPHFQLANVPVTPTRFDREAFASGGLDAVWKQYNAA
jgi:peptidoglycan L-alanyl-D-glutamate endopeptidase CwlK